MAATGPELLMGLGCHYLIGVCGRSAFWRR